MGTEAGGGGGGGGIKFTYGFYIINIVHSLCTKILLSQKKS